MNSPENENTPARDGADEVGAAPETDATQQLPVTQPPVPQPPVVPHPVPQPPVAQQPVPQHPVPQPPVAQHSVLQPPVAQPPAAQLPVAQPTAGLPPLAQPTDHLHPQTPPPPAGWDPHHADQSSTQPLHRPADPFTLFGGYPAAPAPDSVPAPAVGTRTRPQRLWLTVVGTAAATALITSLVVGGGISAFGGNDSTSPSSLATIGQSSTDTAPVSGSTSSDPDWEKVAAAVSASVVAIQVTTTSGGAEGSGVVIDAAGHVLTNNHVVAGATDGTVQVTLSDGRLYKAKVVGTDATTDLAVVQITDPPKDLSPAAFGDSGSVVVGEPVMAVGNPLGLANTVTTGIVSAIDRPVSASAETGNETVVTNAIQIDAAINPGNSGGPLFDAKGQVIGITSSIATLSSGSSQSGSIGLGFAIPIKLAQNIAGQLVESGTAEHAYLGVGLTDGNATADGATRLGAVVQQVTDGSPAAKADVKKGDVVVAIDGQPVAGAESLTAYVRERTAGSTAKLTVVRDGKAVDVTVTLAAKAATVEQNSSDEQSGSGQDGSGQSDQNPFGDFFGGQG